MLPKNKRIPRRLFKSVLGSREYFNSEHFTLRVASSHETRVAVAVSKKISKSAAVRNKVRRRMYSVVGDFVPILGPGLYLIVAKPKAEKVREKELRNELKSLIVSGPL